MPTLKRIRMPGRQRPQQSPDTKGLNQGRRSNHPEVYHTTRWRRLRAQLLREEPLCRACKNATPQRLIAATIADHIVPINDGGEPWEMDNLQPLCEKCHNAKSGRERWRKLTRPVGL